MARIIKINGKQWLAGMSWISFEDVPSKAELQEDADRRKADWYAIRNGETAIQAGFCQQLSAKPPQKIYSLAAMLADSREQPWLGIFKIEEGLWWYIAVRDGHAILPDGDIIGGQAEMEAARERHSGYLDWKYIDGDLAFLAELIAGVNEKTTKVKSLKAGVLPWVPHAVSPVALAAATVVLVLAAGGGYYWWHEQQLEQERARLAAQARMRALLMANNTSVNETSPLFTSPLPHVWLDACSKVILPLPLSRYGWSLNEISCNANAVIVSWKREPGATVMQKPNGDISPEGSIVTETIQLPVFDARGANNGIKLDDAMLRMRAMAQAISMTLVMSKVTPPAPPPVKNQPPLPPPPPYATVLLNSKVSPWQLGLETIPGLRLKKISVSDVLTNSQDWIIEGTIHGN